MSDLEQRLQQLVRVADPDGTVTIRWLATLLADAAGNDSDAPDEPARDLTIDQVAAYFNRSPSTVRGWLGRGELRGYKLNNRDWRVPRPAIAEYQQAQHASVAPAEEEVDITQWRRATAGRG